MCVHISWYLKYPALVENWRYSKASRSGNEWFIEKMVYYSQFPRGGGMPCYWGPYRKAQGSIPELAGKGTLWPRAFIVVSKERNGQGGVQRCRTGQSE